MKKANEITLLKFTEKFDRELVKLLSNDLKTIKATKPHFLTKVNQNNSTVLVA
jgi:hypothetical protein